MDLVQHLEMAITPIVERVPSGPQTHHVGSAKLSLVDQQIVSFTVPAAPVPTEDVHLVFTASGYLNNLHQYVDVFLNEEYTPGAAPFARIFSREPSQDINCVVTVDELVIPAQRWNDLAGGGPVVIYLRPIIYHGEPCYGGEYILVDAAFTYEAPEGRDPVPYYGWATHHLTLAGEPRGVPHRHRGEWRVDMLTGNLVCWNFSGGVGTIGGFGAISIDGSPGHGSITTGEITGVLMRLQTRGECAQA